MLAAADDAARLLERQCIDLDVRMPAGALAELRELPDGSTATTPPRCRRTTPARTTTCASATR